MKRFIKNNLKVFVCIIITTIVVGSVSVYAASQYFAKNISFIPTDENFKKENGESINNVEDALNELYKNSSSGIRKTIEIPIDFNDDSFVYNLGFKPSFVYIQWSNTWSWLTINDKSYSFVESNGSNYKELTSGIYINDKGFSLSVKNHPGLKGLTANIFIVK